MAVAAGTVYVSNGQSGSALAMMTVGWLVSLTAAIVEYFRRRRHPRVADTDPQTPPDTRHTLIR